jgi:hypothetical protein
VQLLVLLKLLPNSTLLKVITILMLKCLCLLCFFLKTLSFRFVTANNNVELAISNYFDAPPADQAQQQPQHIEHEEEPPARHQARLVAAMPAPAPMPMPLLPPIQQPVIVVPPTVEIISTSGISAVFKSAIVRATLCDLNLDTSFTATFENPHEAPMEAVFRYRGDEIVCYGYRVEIGGRVINSVEQE